MKIGPVHSRLPERLRSGLSIIDGEAQFVAIRGPSDPFRYSGDGQDRMGFGAIVSGKIQIPTFGKNNGLPIRRPIGIRGHEAAQPMT